MLKVLSIQSDVLGHSTYCSSMRSYFGSFNDIELNSFWYRDGRSLLSKVINKASNMHLPLLSHNRDYWRARVEWSQGRTSGLLAARELATKRFDLLHFHTQAQAFGSAYLMRTVPTVISGDATAYQASREATVRFPATFRPNIAMEHQVFSAAAHIVTFSEWARQSVIRDHLQAPSKVTAVLPGMRLETAGVPGFEFHVKPRILFVGHDFERKGGWDLLEVFSHSFADKADLHLVTGYPITSSLESVFIHSGISSYTEKWHTLFNASDIFVMTSYAEALGHVFQEAAGHGLALIGSDVGGIPEMCINEENGFIVKPGDKEGLASALERLITNRTLLLQMQKRSRDIAEERFDAQKNFRRIADLFQEVAKLA